MAKKKDLTSILPEWKEMLKEKAEPAEQIEPIDCVALTFQASKDQGFSNFRICTLFILGGKIVHIEKTQEFATFESIARAEVLISASLWNLSSRYQPGLYTTLGGDQRTELLARLKKENSETLEKILPLLPQKSAVSG
jgi:hypothetical protein